MSDEFYQRSFDRAQRAYDNLMPPEDDRDEEKEIDKADLLADIERDDQNEH